MFLTKPQKWESFLSLFISINHYPVALSLSHQLEHKQIDTRKKLQKQQNILKENKIFKNNKE